MNIYDSLTTKREVIERRTIVGPMEQSKAVMAALHDDGWHLTRTGPNVDKLKVFDMNQFLFIAEREVQAES